MQMFLAKFTLFFKLPGGRKEGEGGGKRRLGEEVAVRWCPGVLLFLFGEARIRKRGEGEQGVRRAKGKR